MTHAIRFHKGGGPEVLVWEEVQAGKPGPGEALVRHTAIGLNHVDTYVRSGVYPASLPSGVGTEAAGVVEEIGPGVTEVKAGDRVAYAGGPLGAYSEERVMPADRLIVLPDGIADRQVVAMMLKGLTAQYLLRQIFKVSTGDTILFHAAAGGVGLIACQWAKSLGAAAIGTVGNDEKAKLAKGAWLRAPDRLRARGLRRAGERDHQGRKIAGGLRLRRPGHVHEVARLPQAAGFDGELRPSPGPIGPIDLGIIAQKGSLFFTRPTLVTYTARRADLLAMAKDLFDVVLSGMVRIEINQTYPLKEAAQPHRDLQSRKTTGSTVFTV